MDAVQIQTPGLLQNWAVVGALEEANAVNIPDFNVSFLLLIYTLVA